MRAVCTLDGAKGGIDCDPRDPRAGQVLRRYLEAVRPYIETFSDHLLVHPRPVAAVLDRANLASSPPRAAAATLAA